MKRIALLVAFLAAGGRADAKIGVIDNVPAATLLLPYFEVELDNPNGPNTLFTIHNASASAILTHVTLWSEWGIPVLAFDLYLTGYDLHTIDLRDLFDKGRLPRTAGPFTDPGDRISPRGPLSQDVNFPGCTGGFNPLPPGELTIGREHLRAALAGQPSPFDGRCYGENHGDNIARGYITVDTVNACSGAFLYPSSPGYFIPGGLGIASNRNVLWGTYTLLERTGLAAWEDSLVAIEADANDPETSTAGQYTFYGRDVAWTAADNREPLPTNWAARFVNDGVFTGGTDFIVWRDPKITVFPFFCGIPPSWWPLSYEKIVVWDEMEEPVGLIPDGFGGFKEVDRTFAVRNATNRTASAGPDFLSIFDVGWTFMNLNTFVAPSGGNPPEDPLAAQAWVIPLFRAEGQYRLGFSGIALDSGTAANHANPGE
jgi:hypothetical protein